MEVELIPQGTLIERIRAGGHGLGGILTQTGIGTPVENGKQRIEVNGKSYLLETPLRADFALVQAFLADYLGNLSYALTARNFNPVIAMAADTVIASADNIVPVGVISPDHVVTPALSSTTSSPMREMPMEPQTIIARRIARELSPDIPDGMRVFFQSENGLIGTGSVPEEVMAHPTLTDAAGRPVTALPGASTFDSAMSFGLIRGGHLDLTVLGGLQVDEVGQLANWMIPNKMVPGMGGAMDLVSGAKRVIVAMQHTAKGSPKIVKRCTLPVTSTRSVDLVVTELAAIAFQDGRATLLETAPGISVSQVVAATEAELVIPNHVPEMPQ
jgi:acetate CoA/acetoacetate CoA-transferase beta subunit